MLTAQKLGTFKKGLELKIESSYNKRVRQTRAVARMSD